MQNVSFTSVADMRTAIANHSFDPVTYPFDGELSVNGHTYKLQWGESMADTGLVRQAVRGGCWQKFVNFFSAIKEYFVQQDRQVNQLYKQAITDCQKNEEKQGLLEKNIFKKQITVEKITQKVAQELSEEKQWLLQENISKKQEIENKKQITIEKQAAKIAQDLKPLLKVNQLSREDLINKTSSDIDTLYQKYPNIAQPCFLVSQFVKSGSSVENFQPSPTLLAIAKTGKQIDMGAILSGEEAAYNIGKFQATQYSAKNEEQGTIKNSIVMRGTEKDFKSESVDITARLQQMYPEGCLIKTGGGAGHYAYYDTKNDIVYSGGMEAVLKGVSGITLQEYILNKMNGAIETRQETLSITDCSEDDILSIGYAAVKGLGISYEDWLTWN